jgi:hypothetical protein
MNFNFLDCFVCSLSNMHDKCLLLLCLLSLLQVILLYLPFQLSRLIHVLFIGHLVNYLSLSFLP